MADLHITYVQWQEPMSLGGFFHEVGETGDYSHVPDLADLIAQGVIGHNPAAYQTPGAVIVIGSFKDEMTPWQADASEVAGEEN